MKITPNAKALLDARYYQTGETWPKLSKRVARALSKAEKTESLKKRWCELFTNIIESGELVSGDKILIMGETTGVVEIILKDFYVNDNLTEVAAKGNEVTFKSSTLVRRNDKIYKIESIVEN